MSTMKLIAFTDIHGSYERVDKILSTEKRYDAIIIGGDLTTMGSAREAEDALTLFLSHGKPVLVVAGNMDPPQLEETFSQLEVSINARGVILANVGVFGVSASPFSPLHTPYEISEEEILKRAEKGWNMVQSAQWKIFVPHAPPRKTKLDQIRSGDHVGSVSVRSVIEKHQPDVVVCGHIHESRGQDVIGRSQAINCGPAGKGYYAWIEIQDDVRVEARG